MQTNGNRKIQVQHVATIRVRHEKIEQGTDTNLARRGK